MAEWVSFAGVIVTVDAPTDTPDHQIAAIARSQFMERLGEGSVIEPHDVGVTAIEVISDAE